MIAAASPLPASKKPDAVNGLLNQGRASPLRSRAKRPKDGVSFRLNYKAQLVGCALLCVLRRVEAMRAQGSRLYRITIC